MNNLFVNAQNSSRGGDGEYKRVIDEIKKDGVCPFCPEHLAKYHKNPILKEGLYWILTNNMYPYEGAKYHVLIIHKRHIETLAETVPEAWAEIKSFIEEFAKEKNIPGGSFLLRFGAAAYTGASVSHLHANFISPDGENKERKPIITRIG